MTCKGGNDEECSNSGSAQSSAPDFSYYSISSSASSTRAEGRHMAQYVTCVKSTLKWRSLVLQRRDNKVELQANLREDYEKFYNRVFSWLKPLTSAFTFKTLLRHYAKQALTVVDPISCLCTV